MSKGISATQEARLNSLDRVLESQEPVAGLADDLFAVVDALDAQSALRRSFTDPALSDDDRKNLVGRLLGGKISAPAVRIVQEAAGLRFSSGRAMADALERQGVRAQLRAALTQGLLESTAEELFRFARTVEGTPELSTALGNRNTAIQQRQLLVGRLTDGKVGATTSALLKRAVAARKRNYIDTVDEYVTMAAELRNRALATVTVSRPLTAEQKARLQAILNKQQGRAVELLEVVDPEVIGGVRVQIGDEVIEGTVAGRLDDASRSFQ